MLPQSHREKWIVSQLKIGNAISPREKETEISTNGEQNEFEFNSNSASVDRVDYYHRHVASYIVTLEQK